MITPPAWPTLDIDQITSQNVGLETLYDTVIHRWTMAITQPEVVNISVTASDNEDLILYLTDDADHVLVSVNDVGNGGIERLTNYALNTPGTYYILVRDAIGNPCEYVITVQFAGDDVANGILGYNQSQQALNPVAQLQYWHFYGTTGDNITITVDPDAAMNSFFETFWKLFDIAERINLGDIDNGGYGEVDILSNYTLPYTGLYSIWVSHNDNITQPLPYEIKVTKNN